MGEKFVNNRRKKQCFKKFLEKSSYKGNFSLQLIICLTAQ